MHFANTSAGSPKAKTPRRRGFKSGCRLSLSLVALIQLHLDIAEHFIKLRNIGRFRE